MSAMQLHPRSCALALSEFGLGDCGAITYEDNGNVCSTLLIKPSEGQLGTWWEPRPFVREV